MKKFLLLILIFAATTTVGNAQLSDTLIKYGRNLADAPQWKYLGGGINLDTIAWKDTAYSEPNWITGKSSFGFGTNPPARNTQIPEDATIAGGGPAGARFPTMYFRKVINIANPAAYDSFKLRTKFDDAIVVWVNGVEGYRYNLPVVSNYNTFATSPMPNNGADTYVSFVPSSFFRSGNNAIAVEVHQQAVTSSDLYFDLELIGLQTGAPSLTRNPYLQKGSTDAVTIRWRTDIATNSSVYFGTTQGSKTATVDSSALTTDHEVRITGLVADTKYYYQIGYKNGVVFKMLQGASDNYFKTLPPAGTARKVTIAAFGDCGRNDFNYQTNTLSTYQNYIGSPGNAADAWILLGDNAYPQGSESDYNNSFFSVYGDNILKNHLLFPTPGNHDYSNNDSLKSVRDIPYYTNFSMPSNGESGGVPSGTEAYYSFNVGDVHLISLDSYGKENNLVMADTLAPQTVWLKADLEANTKKWTIVYWHHPPFTFGSHNSDVEGDLQAIRTRFIRILERYGVDMILCGHSHNYERSYLLKGFYDSSSTFNKALHTADSSSGKYNGSTNSCPYHFASEKTNHGTVYVVAGSAGAGTATVTPKFNDPNGSHPFSMNTGGSFIIEVEGNRLDAKFLTVSGTTGDNFTIMKDVNRGIDTTITSGSSIILTASWTGAYNWIDNGGAITRSVSVTPPQGVQIYHVVDSLQKTCLYDSFIVRVTNILPLSLSNYSVKLVNGTVRTEWTASDESNNHYYYTVERSADGKDFEAIANVYSKRSAGASYNCIDAHPLQGLSYYRLGLVSLTGGKHYYDIKKIINGSGFTIVQVEGFHKSGAVNIRAAKDGFISLMVSDISGRTQQSMKIKCLTGNNIVRLNLVPGTYAVQATNNDGERESLKLIIK